MEDNLNFVLGKQGANFYMQPYFNPTIWNIEDDLNFFQMEDYLNFFKWQNTSCFSNWRRPIFCKLKTTSIFLWMEDDLQKFIKEMKPKTDKILNKFKIKQWIPPPSLKKTHNQVVAAQLRLPSPVI